MKKTSLIVTESELELLKKLIQNTAEEYERKTNFESLRVTPHLKFNVPEVIDLQNLQKKLM